MLAKLLMCLYGLKQSPRKWFNTIRALILKLGFKASEHDSCLFRPILPGCERKKKLFAFIRGRHVDSIYIDLIPALMLVILHIQFNI